MQVISHRERLKERLAALVREDADRAAERLELVGLLRGSGGPTTTPTQRRLLAVLREEGAPMRACEIADRLSLVGGRARHGIATDCCILLARGQLARLRRGVYGLPPEAAGAEEGSGR